MTTPGRQSCLATHKQIMGARFGFRSDSEALLGLVEAAYGGHAPHRFPEPGPDIDVDLRLSPSRFPVAAEPPVVRSRLDRRLPRGIMDDRNYAVMSPARRRARVVASAETPGWRYHLRYELIEFAVFVLAARCQGLVPLHAACVGRDGRGILVLGASGTGKSTLALHGLLQGLDFLSEDAVFVRPDGMLATGVASFLHVRADAVDGIDDVAARRWIGGSPVIRRRSGVEKFEADLRQAPRPVRLAAAPLQLVGVVVLSGHETGGARAALAPMAPEDAARCLAAGQPYAATQPGWQCFERRAARMPVHSLPRGRDPASSVDALRRLLD